MGFLLCMSAETALVVTEGFSKFCVQSGQEERAAE